MQLRADAVSADSADALSALGLSRAYVGRGLATGDYDNDGDPDLLLLCAGEAPRLLRVGGVVAFADGQRAVGRDPDPRSAAVRDIGRTLLDSDQFAAVLLPVGTGILAATKRPVR